MKCGNTRACRWLLISGFLLLLSGCGALSVAGTDNLQAIAHEGHYQQPIHAAILDTGWHTGWVLPAQPVWQELPILRPYFPEARVLLVGFGNRGFYEARNPGVLLGLRALFPSPAVVLLQGIPHQHWRSFLLPQVHLLPLTLSPAQFQKLVHYVARAILWKRNGPEPIMREPWYPHGLFFPSTEPYDAFHTCNNWTAQSLHVMGFPVSSSGIFFAGQVQGLWKQIMREKKPAT